MARNKKIHDYDVGVQILDFTGVEFEESDGAYVASVPGFYDILKKSNRKPVLIKGFNPLGFDNIPSDFYTSFNFYDEDPDEELPERAIAILNDGTSISLVGDMVVVGDYTLPVLFNYTSDDDSDEVQIIPIKFDKSEEKQIVISLERSTSRIRFQIGEAMAYVDADYDV